MSILSAIHGIVARDLRGTLEDVYFTQTVPESP
jgi:hypothetical protein